MFAEYLESFTHKFAKWAGSASGFVCAFSSMLVWGVLGYITAFSALWEGALTIYLGVITFLMVFLIQRGQNKELTILQVKLNELLVATKAADNRLITVEELSEKEISEVQDAHRQIANGEDALK